MRVTLYLCFKRTSPPFSSLEPTILLACGRDRELWPIPTLKSAIHGLSFKCGKSDWLRIPNEYPAHTQKIGFGQSSRPLPQARRIVGSGEENEESSCKTFHIENYFDLYENEPMRRTFFIKCFAQRNVLKQMQNATFDRRHVSLSLAI